ncbi:MAG TPA: response regulator transcription factor [Solirubrobacterales bacterium]|nr:response regulator transcription factor [Solirubrobacterales bacterium]
MKADPVKPRLQVLSDNLAVSRRIAAACGEGGLTAVRAISSPEQVDEAAIDSSTIFVCACDVDEADGMAALRRLHREQGKAPIIVISPPATGTGVRRALDAGADAIVFEPEIETTLAVTALAVASGQSVVPRKLRASIERPAFSHRERQVLALVSRGLTNSEIAERMLLAQSTVKSHLSSAFTKLGIRSRKEVTALLLDPEQARSVGLLGVGTAAPDPEDSATPRDMVAPVA